MFGAKAQIAALEKGLEFDLVMVPYTSEFGYSPTHPEVLRVNPKRQVPVLVHGDLDIFDSTQIFEYLEDLQPTPALWPRDIRDRANARRLEHQSDEIFPSHHPPDGSAEGLGQRRRCRQHRAIGVADSHDAATRGARGRQRHGELAESGWTTGTSVYACGLMG